MLYFTHDKKWCTQGLSDGSGQGRMLPCAKSQNVAFSQDRDWGWSWWNEWRRTIQRDTRQALTSQAVEDMTESRRKPWAPRTRQEGCLPQFLQGPGVAHCLQTRLLLLDAMHHGDCLSRLAGLEDWCLSSWKHFCARKSGQRPLPVFSVSTAYHNI